MAAKLSRNWEHKESESEGRGLGLVMANRATTDASGKLHKQRTVEIAAMFERAATTQGS